MTYTSHGHYIEGTINTGPRPDRVARCGGPGICGQCSAEAAVATQGVTVTPIPGDVHIHHPELELTDEDVRIEAIHAATTFLGPSAAVLPVGQSQLFRLADEIGNYIRTGRHFSDDNV